MSGDSPRPLSVAFGEHPPEFVERMAAQALTGFELRIPASDSRADIEAAIRDCDVLIARKRPVGSREMDCAKPGSSSRWGATPSG